MEIILMLPKRGKTRRNETLSLLLFCWRLPEQLLSVRRQARPHKVTSRQLKPKGAVFTTQYRVSSSTRLYIPVLIIVAFISIQQAVIGGGPRLILRCNVPASEDGNAQGTKWFGYQG